MTQQTKENRLVVLKDGETTITTLLNENKECVYSGKSYADSDDIMTFKEATPIINKRLQEKYSGEWTEITKERYHDMLNVLPPMKWEQHNKWSMFAISERTEANYTAHYARVGDKYYSAIRDASTPNKELIKEVMQE